MAESRRTVKHTPSHRSWRVAKEEGDMKKDALQMLLDRMEITDTSIRYGTGIDLRDRQLYRSCFTEEIEFDFSSMGMGEPRMMPADEWVDQALMIVSNYQSTQHIITNHVITVEDDEAICTAYLQARHFSPDGMFTVGGYYTNTLVRTPEGWKIKKLKLTTTWTKSS